MKLVPDDRLLNERFIKRANQNIALKNLFVNIIKEYRGDDLLLSDEQLFGLNYEDLLEVAIGVINTKVAITCEVGEDFDDESDAKCVVVRHHASGANYAGAITGVSNKNGALRVVMYEGIQERFYYFYISLSAYAHLTHSIEIPFFKGTGAPKRKNKWWQYECKSFKHIATTDGSINTLLRKVA